MGRNANVSSLLTSTHDSRKPEEIGRTIAGGSPEQVASNLLFLSRELYRFQEGSSTGSIRNILRNGPRATVQLDPTLIGILREVRTKPEEQKYKILEEVERQASESYLEGIHELAERARQLTRSAGGCSRTDIKRIARENELLEISGESRKLGMEHRAIGLAISSAIGGGLGLDDGHFPIYGFGSQS